MKETQGLLNDFKSLLSDIYNRKMMIREGRKLSHDINKIKSDSRYLNTKKILEKYYYEEGFGIKYMIKYFDLDITNTVLRRVLIMFDIEIRKSSDVTDNLRKLRSKKAINDYKNKTGFFAKGVQEDIKIKTSKQRGVQGYYYNEYLKKYVWLRSSWEYVFAKWLNKNNIKWDVEVKSFKVADKLYRPDFFIYDDNKELIKIVEIKGYWKDKVWKFRVLRENMKENNIEYILIDNIKPYCDNQSYKKELQKWKNCRKLSL